MAAFCHELGHVLYVSPIQKQVYKKEDLLRLFEKGRQKFMDDTVDKLYRAILLGAYEGKQTLEVAVEVRDEATMQEIIEKTKVFLPNCSIVWKDGGYCICILGEEIGE